MHRTVRIAGRGWLAALVLFLPLVAGAGGRADLPAGDGVPSGTVAFFSLDDPAGGCPPGWARADAVAGRLVVGVTAAEDVGVAIGVPLADQEDRTHLHPYAAEVTLPSRNIAGANGGNGQGAGSGEHGVAADTDAGTSGLPFVQLLVCEKP